MASAYNTLPSLTISVSYNERPYLVWGSVPLLKLKATRYRTADGQVIELWLIKSAPHAELLDPFKPIGIN
jgi:hypothetical protein